MKTEKIKIFLVDDDALYLKTIETQFKQKGEFDIETFASGEECLQNISHNPDVIILDYQLNGIVKNAMNGIEVLDKIKETKPNIAVLMLSSQDKIDVAINCMHHKAVDYVVKSETAFLRLNKIIATVLRFNKMERELRWYIDRM